MDPETDRVGVVGLGEIGRPMSEHLVRRPGTPVAIHGRARDPDADLLDAGARWHDNRLLTGRRVVRRPADAPGPAPGREGAPDTSRHHQQPATIQVGTRDRRPVLKSGFMMGIKRAIANLPPRHRTSGPLRLRKAAPSSVRLGRHNCVVAVTGGSFCELGVRTILITNGGY